ncbi:hypothetical protein, partial [Bradyrhizobium sp. 25ACV]
MAQREEGTVQHHFGAAAKAIEAERAKAQAEAPRAVKSSAPAPASVPPQGFRVVCSEPEREADKVDQLFEAFVSAKKQAGEETAKLT